MSPFCDYQAISPAKEMRFILLFIFFACPKKTNQQQSGERKGPLCPLSRRGRDTLCSSMLPGLCKLGCASNSAKPFFGSLSGARRRANGILTA